MDTNITIRPYLPEDSPLLHAAVMESMVGLAPWLPWCHPAYSLADSQSWVESQIKAFNSGSEYAFVICGPDNRFLGGCGLNHIDRDNLRANLGYWMRSSWQGKGATTAAVRQLVAWSMAHTNLCRLEIIAAVENLASRRVAEKSGATYEGILRSRLRLNGRMHDTAVYSFVRS